MLKKVEFDSNIDVWAIMNILWKNKLGIELEHLKTEYCCDLLNSYNTTFFKESKDKEKIRIWNNNQSKIVDKSTLTKKTIAKVVEFSKQYHSIGNIMPLPIILNSPQKGRANKKTMGDYFDNYLKFVKSYYIPGFDCEYKIKLDETSKEYFKKFKDFNDYVQSNFLQPFFEDSSFNIFKKLDFRKTDNKEELIKKYIEQSVEIIRERETLMLEKLIETFKKYQL